MTIVNFRQLFMPKNKNRHDRGLTKKHRNTQRKLLPKIYPPAAA